MEEPSLARRAARRRAPRAAAAAQLLLALLLCDPAQRHVSACTVVQLRGDVGFATNALYLMRAAPIFHGQNGTLFVDNTDFQYSCAQDGGWHDFFAHDERLVPW